MMAILAFVAGAASGVLFMALVIRSGAPRAKVTPPLVPGGPVPPNGGYVPPPEPLETLAIGPDVPEVDAKNQPAGVTTA